MFKVAVFAAYPASFTECRNYLLNLGLSEKCILHVNSTDTSRWDAINQNLNSWLFFIDHDCRITAETLGQLNLLCRDLPESDILIAGNYSDDSSSNQIQRTHNLVANTWLNQSYDLVSDWPLFLGGTFLIFAKKELNLKVDRIFWGAEDKFLAYYLKEEGFKFVLNRTLKVVHKTDPSYKHFFKRAFLHGKNDVLMIGKNRNRLNLFYWVRNIDFLNLHSVALLLLHFFVQKAAKLVQIIHRLSKSNK